MQIVGVVFWHMMLVPVSRPEIFSSVSIYTLYRSWIFYFLKVLSSFSFFIRMEKRTGWTLEIQ